MAPKKILLAEKDTLLINVYVKRLRGLGYSTSIVSDAVNIAGKIKTINPDLVVIDEALSCGFAAPVLSIIGRQNISGLKIIMLSDFGHDHSQCGPEVVKCIIKAENTPEEVAEEIKKILS